MDVKFAVQLEATARLCVPQYGLNEKASISVTSHFLTANVIRLFLIESL
jgi:hypothetical protein